MPFIKATLFFEQEGYGWTENLWLNGSDTSLATYTGAALSLAKKRIPLCGTQTAITAVRVSTEGVFRDALFADIKGGKLLGDPTKPSEDPTTAILMDWWAQNGLKHRRHFMRGVWDDVIAMGGHVESDADYQKLLNGYIAQVVQGLWGWLTRIKPRWSTIQSVAANPLAGTVIVTTKNPIWDAPIPPVVLPELAKVTISGAHGAYQINGTHNVYPRDVNVFETVDRVAIFPYTTGGKVRTWTMDFQKIDAGWVDRCVERKAGRPSYKSAGRHKGMVKA